jgi:glutamate-5-semialdehyde dehydrogenase
VTVAGAGSDRLERLEAGQPVLYGGDRITTVSEDLAREFAPGDRLVVVQDTGALLRIPAADHALADAAVTAAHQAFLELGRLPDAAVTAFFEGFARRLEDPVTFARIAAANADDVSAAREQGPESADQSQREDPADDRSGADHHHGITRDQPDDHES